MLYFCDTGNFGDDLNDWLWRRLAPEVLDDRSDRLFVGIGTILSPDIPKEPEKFVFGSGWSGEKAPRVDETWKIYGVRGPLTAEGLGLLSNQVLSDPALLVRRFFQASAWQGHSVGFMPHHRSVPLVDWRNLCERNGLVFINPEAGVETVLRQITECRLVLAEAMHGAIIADAFRVPWIPIRAYSHINEFKWKDWCGSLGLPFHPIRLPPIFAEGPRGSKKLEHLCKRTLAPTLIGKSKWQRLPLRKSHPNEVRSFMKSLKKVAETRTGNLSDDDTSKQMETRQLEALENLRQDWQRVY